MVLVVEERDLEIAFGVSLATLVLVCLVQHIAVLVSRLPARLVNFQWYYVSLSCAPVCFVVSSTLSSITWFLVAAGAGLAVASGVRTRRRMVTAFLIGFLLTGQCLEQLSHVVNVVVPPKGETWVSQYRGQTALWPEEAGSGPRSLLVLYENVVLTRMPCENTGTAGASTQSGLLAGLGDRHLLVSFGDNTRVGAMEGCRSGGCDQRVPWHVVTLLGENNLLEDVTVRCRVASGKESSAGRGGEHWRCLTVNPSTMFRNVSLEFYSDDGLDFVAKIHLAENCADASLQLQRLRKAGVEGEKNVLTCIENAGSHRFSQYVQDPALVPSVLRVLVPYFFRCVWYMPMTLRNIPSVVTSVADYVIFPLGGMIASASFAVIKAIVLMCWDLLPDFNRILNDAGMFVLGSYCRAVGATHLSLCSAPGDDYAVDRYYQFGVFFVDCSYDAVKLVLDALELFPGLWQVTLWTLYAEWRLTLYCVHLIEVIIVSAVFCVWYPAREMLRVAVAAVGALERASSTALMSYDFSTIADVVGTLFTLLYRLLWGLFAMEAEGTWKLFWWLLSVLFGASALVFDVMLGVGTASLYVIFLYTNTTLYTHSLVALVQTGVVLIAMRNELNDVASRECRRYPNFVKQYVGGVYLAKLTYFAKLHSVVLLRYAAAHLLLIFTLIGLSVVGIFSKLYNLTLYIVFPLASSTVFLEFFTAAPQRWSVVQLSVGKGLLIIVLDRTIGDFAAYVMGEVFFLVGVVLAAAACIWGWQKGIPLLVLRLLVQSVSAAHPISSPGGEAAAAAVAADACVQDITDSPLVAEVRGSSSSYGGDEFAANFGAVDADK